MVSSATPKLVPLRSPVTRVPEIVMSLLGRVSQPTFAGAFFLLALVLASVSAGLQRFPLPSHDAEHYLGYARSLYLTGQFAATPQGPAADRTPGREPLYSVLVAGTAKVVPALGRALADCAPLAEPCKGGLRLLVFVNAALLALGATFALLTVIELGGTRAAALIGGLYVACNGHMHADLVHTYSDFLAVALSCAASRLAGPGASSGMST